MIGTDRLQNLDEIPAALARLGLVDEDHAAWHRRIVEFVRRYARLERKLLNDVPVQFPAYLLETRLPEDPIAAGESLAELERPRLRLGHEEAGDVRALLDRQGFKVYEPPSPSHSPLEGLFLFDRDVGPVFVVDGRLADAERDFVLARLYGHFLADHDPYEIRFALRGDVAADSPNTLRAQAFAAAFLVDREGLLEYLKHSGHDPAAPIGADLAFQLAVFFEVGARSLLSRLLTLGLLPHDGVGELFERLRSEFAETVPEREGGAVPERFVRLALEAHARGMLTAGKLAVYLETEPAAARALASRFRLEPEPSVVAETAAAGEEDLDA